MLQIKWAAAHAPAVFADEIEEADGRLDARVTAGLHEHMREQKKMLQSLKK
jgi:hypothetical protein